MRWSVIAHCRVHPLFRHRLVRGLVVAGACVLWGATVLWSKTEVSGRDHLDPRVIFRKTAGQWGGDIFLLPKRYNYMLDAKEFDPKVWYPSSIRGRLLPPHPVSSHGVAWDYDLRIPLVFYDPSERWFKAGVFSKLAVQQDIVPTLAHILDVPAPAKRGGRILAEALAPAPQQTKPKAMVIFVQDQMGVQYLNAHPKRAPFYESLMARGARFTNASVAHVDVETSVGHASIGTGAWPSEHGVSGNLFFHQGFWRQIPAHMIWLTGGDERARAYNPSFYFTPTLSDVWSVARAQKPVILAVAPAARAAISMGGHGALFNGGTKTHVVWNDGFGNDGQWTTQAEHYVLPAAFADKPVTPWVKQIVDGAGRWRGHELIGADGIVRHKIIGATPAEARQQGALTRQAIQDLKIGSDAETDLVWVNMKSTDYCGHAFGYESDECGDVLAAADDEARQIIDLIAAQTGGSFVVVLTADHGAAPIAELSGGYRLDRSQLKKDLNMRFDKRDNQIDAIQVVTASQVFINRSELKANGFAIKDVVTFIKSYKASMAYPYNILADEWLKKGKQKQALFFADVVAVDDLR
jgi:hypothetical protein